MIIIHLHETLNKQKQTKQSQKITRSDKSIQGRRGTCKELGSQRAEVTFERQKNIKLSTL